MGYNLPIIGAYWGYNPLTNLSLTSWDIQVNDQCLRPFEGIYSKTNMWCFYFITVSCFRLYWFCHFINRLLPSTCFNQKNNQTHAYKMAIWVILSTITSTFSKQLVHKHQTKQTLIDSLSDITPPKKKKRKKDENIQFIHNIYIYTKNNSLLQLVTAKMPAPKLCSCFCTGLAARRRTPTRRAAAKPSAETVP